jgi:hypothetical protein
MIPQDPLANRRHDPLRVKLVCHIVNMLNELLWRSSVGSWEVLRDWNRPIKSCVVMYERVQRSSLRRN